MHSPLLGPVVALVAWTTLFRIWMALRHNAAAKRAAADAATSTERNPYSSALWEQPTRFYAIVFALMFMGFEAPINVWLAWAYVGFRVVHGLVQATTDHARTVHRSHRVPRRPDRPRGHFPRQSRLKQAASSTWVDQRN